MRSFLLISLIGSCLWLSCQSPSPLKSTTINGFPEQSVVRLFSDSLQADTFKVSLQGKNTKEQRLIFQIMNAKGEKIYEEVILGSTLLEGYMGKKALKSESEKAKYIEEEFLLFLDEEHFMLPAVMENEQPDQNVADKAFYQELKQTAFPGFIFERDKETKVYIAWSLKEGKVKVYYKCC